MSANGNGFTETTFRWLADLEANNDSTWFRENKETFTTYVDERFTHLLEEVSGRLAGTRHRCAGAGRRRSA